jgi:hypothetical protein
MSDGTGPPGEAGCIVAVHYDDEGGKGAGNRRRSGYDCDCFVNVENFDGWRISMGGALRCIRNFPGGVESHFQQNKFARPKQDRSAQARSDHQLWQSQGG